MFSRRSILVTLAAGAAGVGALFVWQRYEGLNAQPEWIASGNGRLEMTRTDVAVKYPGRVTLVRVQEGDSVRYGDLIAVQDQKDVAAQLAGAAAAKASAEAALSRAEGEWAVRDGQRRSAHIDWQQSTILRSKDMVSAVELEQREVTLATARSAVVAASGGVGEARSAIEQAAAQITRLKATMSDLQITAPVSGRVEYRIVEPGTVLPAGGKVVSLVNPADVYLVIFLPARIAGRLRLGDEARIYPEGFSQPVPARVTFVSPDAQFTPKFVETRAEREKLTYRVKLQVPPDVARRLDGQLKAGMTADGFVKLERSRPWPRLEAGER